MSFKSGYQGGPYFELFSTQGRDSMTNWKESSSGIKKIYEKDVKGFVLILEGSPATTKLCSPKDQKQSLTLVQRFLVMQLFLPKGVDFSLELGLTDLGNNKRRILLSTAQKETQITPLHAKFPLAIVRRAVWLNLVIDMVSFVGETWTNQTFRCVDQISISANCKLRRVFTMKSQPPDTTDDDELYGCVNPNNGELDSFPKQCQMTPSVAQQTQVLTYSKIKCAERVRSAKSGALSEQSRSGSLLDLDLSVSGRRAPVSDNKIAFGSKAPRAPETGRKTSRQNGLSNRSVRSQTSQNENNSNYSGAAGSDNSSNLDGLPAATGQFDLTKPRPPASAGPSLGGLSSNTSYSRQQSEPVTQEDFGYVANGLREKQLAFQQPHPPREPSSDRVRRRPRIKSLGQNGLVGKGESNVISPPTSAVTGQTGSRGSSAQPISVSPATASTGLGSLDARTSTGLGSLDARTSTGLGSLDARNRDSKKDSGVGPDVPEIQSPRKGENVNPTEGSVYTEYDSVADVISLLSGADTKVADGYFNGDYRKQDVSYSRYEGVGKEHREVIVKDSVKLEARLGPERSEEMKGRERDDDDEDSNLSTSASESSHPGEYEESDDETSGERNKLHFFTSPPKSASFRRNISPISAEIEINKSQKSSQKSFRSNVKLAEISSNRGARLEDDFVSHNSSDDDPAAAADLLHHHLRMQRSVGGPGSAGSQGHINHSHNNNGGSHISSGYHSSYVSSTASNAKSRENSATKTRRGKIVPKTSASPDQRPTFDPKLYSDFDDRGQNSAANPLSRMSKKSLREINNPFTDGAGTVSSSSNKPYDRTKYQPAEMTDSFEAGMLATMAQEAEDELEDVLPASGPALVPQTGQNFQQKLNPTEMIVSHLHSESPATTSDDDTSFSTWKAPALNQIPHNYQDEMKSRRSSDTLTSSNPRDWSGVMSPPIGTLSGQRNLEGTMEGISDDLSDDAATSQGQRARDLKGGEEEEKLDLLFDPKLNCYYDPKSKKWYELVS